MQERGSQQRNYHHYPKAVEIIRALPNGWDMSKYPLDAP